MLITKPPFIVNLFFPSNGDGQVSKDIDWLGYGFTFLGTLFTGTVLALLKNDETYSHVLRDLGGLDFRLTERI